MEQLVVRFGDRRVLEGVDLSVSAGETVALIGPSGGGKSTLLRCVNGLCPFRSGRIRVGELELAPDPHSLRDEAAVPQMLGPVGDIRRAMGMVFQDFQLFPHLSVLGNVVEAPIRVLGQPREQAEATAIELLARVGLADRRDAKPHQLSGGQKQRVAIARALAMGPKGLLCDEITSALDPALKHEVLGVLEDLKQEGMTLVVVTHEIGFARRSADRVVVLADGLAIEQGPPEQVIDAPQEKRTQEFLRNVLA
ncbi:MAG: amino acid ABC transporter ATP-binding protein [Pirellulales bacterium]|nr:amino acid ABC transporter ATP-binding protein [Pirellulales bacterium]